jgi:cystathionine beta-lyase family protein involved in aluminum resistance
MIEALLGRFDVSPPVAKAARAAAARVARIERPDLERVKASVLRAFFDEGLSESDLRESYGYGYDDPARDRYESLLCRIFGAERALARLSLVSGTHAIVTALEACLPRGGRLVAATGSPYDTLRNAIADASYSLVERGIQYDEVSSSADAEIDPAAVAEASAGADVVFVQRSRGYAVRRSLSVDGIAALVGVVRDVHPAAIVFVDNCYGELVEEREPLEAGADVLAGSLIKNLGGGLAPAGGYLAGSSERIERIAARIFAPGIGAALGPTLGFGRAFVQGLFYAPLVVAEALRGLDFAAALFAELGFAVDPLAGDARTDIVQAIRLGSRQRLLAFARGLQRALPVNARFAPEPGPVPGYAEPVVMSSGSFVAGATIELSCDAPLREPYEVYLQGGVTAEHAVLGAALAAEARTKCSVSRSKGRRPQTRPRAGRYSCADGPPMKPKKK